MRPQVEPMKTGRKTKQSMPVTVAVMTCPSSPFIVSHRVQIYVDRRYPLLDTVPYHRGTFGYFDN
jgi:hypothetical protein